MKVETFHRRLVSLDLLEYKILDFYLLKLQRPAVNGSGGEETFSMFHMQKAIQ